MGELTPPPPSVGEECLSPEGPGICSHCSRAGVALTAICRQTRNRVPPGRLGGDSWGFVWTCVWHRATGLQKREGTVHVPSGFDVKVSFMAPCTKTYSDQIISQREALPASTPHCRLEEDETDCRHPAGDPAPGVCAATLCAPGGPRTAPEPRSGQPAGGTPSTPGLPQTAAWPSRSSRKQHCVRYTGSRDNGPR